MFNCKTHILMIKLQKMILKEIQKPVENLIRKADNTFKKNTRSDIDLINKIINSSTVNKGKQIRSTLLFLLAKLNNCITDDLPLIATSIEMLHLSSLIHDDIIDNSILRRGKKTLNADFGNYISVLGGDYFFINSLNLMKKINQDLIMEIILKVSKSMIEGQILEVENSFNFNIDPDTYFKIITNKTAALFAGISEIVFALKNEESGSIEKFHKFGQSFGIIFQICDDMLDIFSKNSGKDHFRDLKEGKITLPYILLLKKTKTKLIKNFSDKNQKLLLELFEKFKIKDLYFKEIDKYYTDGVNFLNSFPDSIYRKSIFELLDFIKYRDY